MPNPIANTFEILAHSKNAHALVALILALDVPDETIRFATVKSLLKRHSSRGHLELIRRHHELTAQMRELFQPYANAMNKALRQSILTDNLQTQTNALEMIRDLEVYDMLPVVLEMLADEKHEEHHRYCLETVDDLVNKIYERVHHTSKEKKYLRDVQKIQLRIVAALEKACKNPNIPGYEQLLENLLILGDLEVNEIRKLLRKEGHPHRPLAEEMLLNSDHPGIMQLILDFLGLSYCSPLAFRCVAQRDDPQFICHLLRQWPRNLSISQCKNYKQIETLSWLEAPILQLEIIPSALHVKLINFVNATSLPLKSKLRTAEWVVSHGCDEARRVATEMLEDLDNGRMHSLIKEGLESQDEEVQAWATSQLRTKNIPEAFTKLIERLDSPMPQVQQAAREELEDFNLNRILTFYDLLDPRTCKLVGSLLLKINPDTTDQLTAEMTGPMRSKRMRAIQAAIAMGLQEPLLQTFIALLEDEDVLIRRTAVEAVAEVPGVESAQALQELRDDPSPRIQELAAKGLLKMQAEASETSPNSLNS